MHLDARVAESDVARIRNEQAAEIRINAYRGEVFDGDVSRIALQRTLDSTGAGYFKTEVRLNLGGRTIYSGLAANVDILVGDHEGLVIPSQAVVDRVVDRLPQSVLVDNPLVDETRSAIPVVYVVRDGAVVATPVRSGPSSLTDTLILEGLREGDAVVTGPYKALEKIRHGDRVTDIAASEPGDPEESGETGIQVSF